MRVDVSEARPKATKLVVGFDGSAPSAVALDWALARATDRHLPVEVVHAWHLPATATPDGWTSYVTSDDCELAANHLVDEAIEKALARVATIPPPVTTRVVMGDAAESIVAAAENAEIVVGSSGHGFLGRLVLGSVAERVLAESLVPVTVVPPDTLQGAASHRIVVGVDGSSTSATALAYTVDVAKVTGAHLDVVSAYPIVSEMSRDVMRRDAEAVIEHMLEQIEGAAPPIRKLALAGYPAARLLETARGASELVVGYTGAAKHPWRFGSVSRRCVHEAHCPVTVVNS
jgi:nucleotide-binding universal stress UspA family protein